MEGVGVVGRRFVCVSASVSWARACAACVRQDGDSAHVRGPPAGNGPPAGQQIVGTLALLLIVKVFVRSFVRAPVRAPVRSLPPPTREGPCVHVLDCLPPHPTRRLAYPPPDGGGGGGRGVAPSPALPGRPAPLGGGTF